MKATIFYLVLCLLSDKMTVNAGGFFGAVLFDILVRE